jgi:hypothetical protein
MSSCWPKSAGSPLAFEQARREVDTRGTRCGSSAIRLRNNVTKDLSDAFVSAREGNLHLSAEVPGVTDRAERLVQVSDDIDKQPRGGKPDIGADER